MNDSGLLISLCGVDGSGKTTQAILLKDYIMREYCRDVKVIHGLTPQVYYEELIKTSKTLSPALYSTAILLDLLENSKNIIEPALAENNVIITDRYIIDSIVELPLFECRIEIAYAFASIVPKPNISILLNLPPEVAYSRLIAREKIGIKKVTNKETYKFIKNACDGYNGLFEQEKIAYSVDAEASIQKVHESVIGCINNALSL